MLRGLCARPSFLGAGFLILERAHRGSVKQTVGGTNGPDLGWRLGSERSWWP